MGRGRVALVWVASGLAMAGCPAKPLPPLDPAALRATAPRTLVAAVDRSPPITAEGPAREGPDIRSSFGLLGAAMIASRDMTANQRRARWMKGCKSEDPVDEIRETLAEELAQAFSLHLLATPRRTKAKDPEDVVKDYPGTDLILDVRTSRWGIHRINAASVRGEVHFAVLYEGSLRLIDARKQAVIAEATCSVQFSNKEEPPTITELLEDDCELLGTGLALTSETCTRRLRAALGLQPPD